MVPKIIHYCWFGGAEKSELVQKCLASWKKYCPDYSIIEWNEENWNVNYNQYTYEAFQEKKWAFVSDVARLDVVYRYGGLYLDTDVELLASPQKYMESGWIAFESPVMLATGLGFAAEAGNVLIKAALKEYDGCSFYKKNGSLDLTACPYRNTSAFKKQLPFLKMDNTTQSFSEITIISEAEYKTFACHHGASSWLEKDSKPLEQGSYRDTKLKQFLRNPQRINWLDKHLPEPFFRGYVFVAYDLLEHGLPWMLQKVFKKFYRK